MNARVQNHVVGRLSLRPPQAESLAKLAHALDTAPELLRKERDVAAILSALKREFPTLEDFEREFPSLCFALATGVGKTRLMGAFIAYLHLAHGINNFFVLAPNLTIYNKLITDFTRNTPKYVFKGIAEFAQQSPLIITGDNYDQTGAVVQDQTMGFAHDVRINIFNISKINSEVRGGKEPRIKRMKEVLGDPGQYVTSVAANLITQTARQFCGRCPLILGGKASNGASWAGSDYPKAVTDERQLFSTM
jgi:type III restriction enzyme